MFSSTVEYVPTSLASVFGLLVIPVYAKHLVGVVHVYILLLAIATFRIPCRLTVHFHQLIMTKLTGIIMWL